MKQSDYGVSILRNASGEVVGASLGWTDRVEHKNGVAWLAALVEKPETVFNGDRYKTSICGVLPTQYFTRSYVTREQIISARRSAGRRTANSSDDLVLSLYREPVREQLADILCRIVGNEPIAAAWANNDGFVIRARGAAEKAALYVLQEALLQRRIAVYEAARESYTGPGGFALVIADKAVPADYQMAGLGALRAA